MIHKRQPKAQHLAVKQPTPSTAFRPKPLTRALFIAATTFLPLSVAQAIVIEINAGFQPTSTLSGFATPGDEVQVFAYSQQLIASADGTFQTVRNAETNSTFGIPAEFPAQQLDPANFPAPPEGYTPLVGAELLVNNVPDTGYFVESGTLSIDGDNSSYARASYGEPGICNGEIAGRGPRGSAWGGSTGYDPVLPAGNYVANAGICAGSDDTGNPTALVSLLDLDGIAELMFTNSLRDASGESTPLWSITLAFGTVLSPAGYSIDVQSADNLNWFDPITQQLLASDEEMERLLDSYLTVDLTSEELVAFLNPPVGDQLQIGFQFETNESLELVENFQVFGAAPVTVNSPATLALLLSGVLGLGWSRRRSV